LQDFQKQLINQYNKISVVQQKGESAWILNSYQDHRGCLICGGPDIFDQARPATPTFREVPGPEAVNLMREERLVTSKGQSGR
jgi:hypothetical protein